MMELLSSATNPSVVVYQIRKLSAVASVTPFGVAMAGRVVSRTCTCGATPPRRIIARMRGSVNCNVTGVGGRVAVGNRADS